MQQVLSTTTSASASSSARAKPSASSNPAIRSESCSFIWHPYVCTTYLRCSVIPTDYEAVPQMQSLRPRLPGEARPRHTDIVTSVIAIVNSTDTAAQLLYLVHILSAIAAFGPLFLYPRMQRAGETQAVAALHMKLVFPALILMWVAGMGMAGVQEISLGGTWFVTGTIVLWLVAVVVS